MAVLAEQCLSPVPGGTGRYTADLLAALGRTTPPGWAVESWVAWHRDVRPAVAAGVRGPRRLVLPRRPLIATWERGLGPAPRRAGVVHAPTLLVPPVRSAPLVVTIHDAVPWTHPETLTARGVAFHRRMAARVVRSAELVIVPTNAVRDELTRFLPGLPRTEVVPEGVSARLALPPDADQRARRLRLPADGYLLTVATLEPRKGLDLLLEALATPQVPDLPLVVVGPAGWGGIDPRALARRAGLADARLRLLGWVSDPDLAVCYARASAVVVPSRAEGFGLPVLEAMALGAPVVATTVPALAEVAGDAAELVRPDRDALANALRTVLEQPAYAERLVTSGRRRAAEFDWERSGRRLWELYLGLAEKGTSRS